MLRAHQKYTTATYYDSIRVTRLPDVCNPFISPLGKYNVLLSIGLGQITTISKESDNENDETGVPANSRLMSEEEEQLQLQQQKRAQHTWYILYTSKTRCFSVLNLLIR